MSKTYLSQYVIFGGFAPNSQTAEVLSKAMGSRTVMSGSVSRGKNDPSQSLQMMERPLMTPDELKSIPKGTFIVMKTGTHPMRTKLQLFFNWGITFDRTYAVAEKAQRKVLYADKAQLEQNILKKYGKAQTAKDAPTGTEGKPVDTAPKGESKDKAKGTDNAQSEQVDKEQTVPDEQTDKALKKRIALKTHKEGDE